MIITDARERDSDGSPRACGAGARPGCRGYSAVVVTASPSPLVCRHPAVTV